MSAGEVIEFFANEMDDVVAAAKPQALTLADAIAELLRMRKCTRCTRMYREQDNLAALRCAYHPGDVCMIVRGLDCADTGLRLGQYSCCKRTKTFRGPVDRGCMPCDHTSQPHGVMERDIEVSQEDARVLLPPDIMASLLYRANNNSRFVKHTGNRTNPSFRIFRCAT